MGTSETRAASSRTDNTSLAIGLTRLEERLRSTSAQVSAFLKMQQIREEDRDRQVKDQSKFEAWIEHEIKLLSKHTDKCNDLLASMDKRLQKLEHRRESDDRRMVEAEATTAPHRELTILETTQRVEESKWRSRLWKALAASVASLGGGLAAWLATRK